MAVAWFYKSESDGAFGPVSASELKKLALGGHVVPSTMVLKGDDGLWVLASKVKGLFDQDPKDLPPFPSAAVATIVTSQSTHPSSPNVSARADASAVELGVESTTVLSKQGLSPAMLIAVGSGGTLIIVGLIVVGGMIFAMPQDAQNTSSIGVSTGTTNPTTTPVRTDTTAFTEQNLAAANQIAEPSFRKEIFEKVHRAAVDYAPGKDIQLARELELIESAIKGENEQEVFNLFKVVMEIQTDMNILEVGKMVTEKTAKDFKAVSPSTKQITASIGGAAKDKYDELAATAAISQAGGVAVSSKISPKYEKTMKLLLDRQPLTPLEQDGVRWIPYETTQSELRIMEKATLKVAADAFNNGGKMAK